MIPSALRTAAWFFSQNPENPTARVRFETELQANEHPAILVALADTFSAAPAIAVLALRRLTELSPQNVGYAARLGFAHYMAGEDDAAVESLHRAQQILPDDLEVLNLAAALARDDDTRRDIYARILELHPNNRAAFDNLVLLRRPEDDH